jgi:hypothetical protein
MSKVIDFNSKSVVKEEVTVNASALKVLEAIRAKVEDGSVQSVVVLGLGAESECSIATAIQPEHHILMLGLLCYLQTNLGVSDDEE